MIRQYLNLRTFLAIVAIFIVSGTIIYSQYLARKIAKDEKIRVDQWSQAARFILRHGSDSTDSSLADSIIRSNTSIPIIEADQFDRINDQINLDTSKISKDSSYLVRMLNKFKSINPPLVYPDPLDSSRLTKYYYGHTKLLDEVRYYPIIQLLIVALFILIIFLSLRGSYRSTQNQVWAGMAKETAHQLGTPVSSLEGWVEMLKEKEIDQQILQELEKDVSRLRLISDRFGKIGSRPQLEEMDLIQQIRHMMDYMKKRATGKIVFGMDTHEENIITAHISPPLFDWVIENLLKNALDAMEGKGSILVDIHKDLEKVYIDVTDTGKGISKTNAGKVFKPGFTTKKRGWGLGLSLSRRIIETYHRGEIFVKHSEPGKGTTFRIVLKK